MVHSVPTSEQGCQVEWEELQGVLVRALGAGEVRVLLGGHLRVLDAVSGGDGGKAIHSVTQIKQVTDLQYTIVQCRVNYLIFLGDYFLLYVIPESYYCCTWEVLTSF